MFDHVNFFIRLELPMHDRLNDLLVILKLYFIGSTQSGIIRKTGRSLEVEMIKYGLKCKKTITIDQISKVFRIKSNLHTQNLYNFVGSFNNHITDKLESQPIHMSNQFIQENSMFTQADSLKQIDICEKNSRFIFFAKRPVLFFKWTIMILMFVFLYYIVKLFESSLKSKTKKYNDCKDGYIFKCNLPSEIIIFLETLNESMQMIGRGFFMFLAELINPYYWGVFLSIVFCLISIIKYRLILLNFTK